MTNLLTRAALRYRKQVFMYITVKLHDPYMWEKISITAHSFLRGSLSESERGCSGQLGGEAVSERSQL